MILELRSISMNVESILTRSTYPGLVCSMDRQRNAFANKHVNFHLQVSTNNLLGRISLYSLIFTSNSSSSRVSGQTFKIRPRRVLLRKREDTYFISLMSHRSEKCRSKYLWTWTWYYRSSHRKWCKKICSQGIKGMKWVSSCFFSRTYRGAILKVSPLTHERNETKTTWSEYRTIEENSPQKFTNRNL